MLNALLDWLNIHLSIALFGYISFRSIMAFLTAFFVNWWAGPRMIAYLRSFQMRGQPIRPDGPASHLSKKAGVPTMGGVFILLGFGVGIFLWSHLSSPPVLWLIA